MIKTLLDNLFLLNESLLNLLHSCLHSLCYNFFLESKTYFSTKNSKIVPVQVVVLLYIHTVIIRITEILFEIFQDELLD